MNATPTNPSWHFGRLLQLHDKLLQGLHWIVGNGETINVWKDPWVVGCNLQNNQLSHDPNLKVYLLINQNKQWNLQVLQHLFPNSIVDQVLKIKIPSWEASDKLIWKLNADGHFTTKSVKQIINTRNQNEERGKWI